MTEPGLSIYIGTLPTVRASREEALLAERAAAKSISKVPYQLRKPLTAKNRVGKNSKKIKKEHLTALTFIQCKPSHQPSLVGIITSILQAQKHLSRGHKETYRLVSEFEPNRSLIFLYSMFSPGGS